MDLQCKVFWRSQTLLKPKHDHKKVLHILQLDVRMRHEEEKNQNN